MSEVILKIENLSKQYRLGLVGTGTLSDDLKRWWYNVRGKEDPFLKIGDVNNRATKGTSDYVWALKDINFEVQQGEVLGIIGKNGAGKSTLLKILSKITSPTTGSIKSRGRVASLLEVGTGFHGEMTGRENIFLNGAILGMTKKEINAKLEEIIEFSGCERYIDTPVKRYSSGMTVRLAFAVAAFLEPDILIIDEVLAVGDAEFQKKAIGKMQEISKGEGRTVLFVSHNMAAVKSLCTRGIVLENGGIVFDGDVDNAVNYYLKAGSESAHRKIFEGVFDNQIFKLHEIAINNAYKNEDEPIIEDEDIELTTKLTLLSENPERYHVTYHLFNEMGEALFSFSNSQESIVLQRGLNNLICNFPKSFLHTGQYFLSLFIVEDKRKAIFVEKDILSFTIINAQREIGVYMGKEPGSISPVFIWKTEQRND